jgi:hypothetical protein
VATIPVQFEEVTEDARVYWAFEVNGIKLK